MLKFQIDICIDGKIVCNILREFTLYSRIYVPCINKKINK